MNRRRAPWHFTLIVLALCLGSATLAFWGLAALLTWLTPWFAMPAPALTRGELALILLCLAIVCGNWSNRR